MAGKRIRLIDYFASYRGGLSEKDYARSLIRDKDNEMAVCKKPKYTKKQRKAMAQRPQIKRFNEVNAEAQRIYHDPVLRAEWEQRHAAFRAEAHKRNEYEYPRLWDFIRHELNLAKIAASK